MIAEAIQAPDLVTSRWPRSASELRAVRIRAERKMRLHRRLDRAGQLLPLIAARYPSFVYPGLGLARDVVPIFVQHELLASEFERTLEYLSRNGYRTITCNEFVRLTSTGGATGKEVMLTFDDGLRWMYDEALPLLKRYDCRAVSFVCPGLIEDHHGRGDDASSGLCTWEQLREMVDTGLVNVQCHGLRHARVWTSPTVIGLLGPQAEHVVRAERLLPAFRRRTDSGAKTATRPSFGAPIHPHRPALQSSRRFDDPEFTERCLTYAIRYGERFHNHPAWRSGAFAPSGRWITGKERAAEMRDALIEARKLLADRLSPTCAEHFAWPWWQGCAMAQWAVREAGFETTFCGPAAYRYGHRTESVKPHSIPRLSLDWHRRLPGNGRESFGTIVRRKLRE
jgi:hypothetical protein